MLRRSLVGLLGLSAGVAGLVMAGAPAGADPGGNLHSTALSDQYLVELLGSFGVSLPGLPFTCNAGFDLGGPDYSSFSGTGNAVVHVNDNANGVWATISEEGQATLTTSDGDTYAGHLNFMFGLEGNRQNQVIHFTFDLQGSDQTTDTPASIHVDVQMATNAVGSPTAQHATVSCR